MNNTQSGNSGLASNPLKTFQTPNSGLAQNVISANLHSLHNPLGFVQILSVTAGYSQMKKDSVQAVLIQFYTDLPSLRGSVTSYPDYIGLAQRLPNSIGSVQRLPDDIGLVPVILTAEVCTKPTILAQSGCSHMNIPSAGGRDLNHVNDIHSVQPFGSMPSLSNSFRPRFLSQLAKLIFDCFAAASNCSFSSGVILILNCGDCPSPLGLLSLLIVDKWPPIKLTLLTLGGHNITVIPKKAMPRGALTLTGHLTTTDNTSIEEAMKDHITPVTGRNSFTPNIKFLWRFFSCQQSRYFTVAARSEQEARSMLPDAPCLFSARIRQSLQNTDGVSA